MSMVRTEAIVLRRLRYSESSLIVRVFARDAGKVALIAKGARHPKSPFGASLEPVTKVALLYSSRPGREMQTARETDILEPYSQLKTDWRRLAFASAACELVLAVTPPEVPESAVYGELVEALGAFEAERAEVAERLWWRFQYRLLATLGYEPQFARCVSCQRAAGGPSVRVSPARGGIVCATCGESAPDDITVTMGTVRTLERLATGPAEVERIQLNVQQASELRCTLERLFNAQVAGYRTVRSLELVGAGR
jgi:DNA repair protein RecO (recombination protein O)